MAVRALPNDGGQEGNEFAYVVLAQTGILCVPFLLLKPNIPCRIIGNQLHSTICLFASSHRVFQLYVHEMIMLHRTKNAYITA